MITWQTRGGLPSKACHTPQLCLGKASALFPCQELIPMLSHHCAKFLNPFSRKQVVGTLISLLNTSQDWRLMVSIQARSFILVISRILRVKCNLPSPSESAQSLLNLSGEMLKPGEDLFKEVVMESSHDILKSAMSKSTSLTPTVTPTASL